MSKTGKGFGVLKLTCGVGPRAPMPDVMGGETRAGAGGAG